MPISNRKTWLAERRRVGEQRMDTLFAPTYDEDWGTTIEPTYVRMLALAFESCPPGASMLDAACGTGKYFPILLEHGYTVTGIDRSGGILAKAHAKFPHVPLRKLTLQDLNDTAAYDFIVCIDAMENVCPEEWSLVLGNLSRALRPGGLLYITVELAAADEIRAAYATGRELGLPVVMGERAHEGGCHYYPDVGQVRTWLAEAGFSVKAEATGDGYDHYLVANP